MSTDASYRFERGVDPEGLQRALERAANLIVATAGGSLDGPVMDVSDGYLFQKIKNGGIWFEMGPYGLEYSDEDIWNLVNFIRSVKKK